MIVAADIAKGIYTGEDILSAYMMPTKTLVKAYPDLSLAVRKCLEPAPEPFLHLQERFADTLYFPTWEDLQQGRFYFHAGYHQQLEQHLTEQRRALIVGRSGSGKTALAYSLGFHFVQKDPVHQVFYTDAAPRTPAVWLEAMRTHDRPEYLFVIDNAHDFPDACNEFLDSFGAVRHACLLLVSQPLPESLAGPEDESYLGRLRPHRAELRLDTEQLEGVLNVFTQLAHRGQMIAPDIGNKQKLLHKCQGNLYLLKYYFMAWEKQPQCVLSDIEESAVLGNIHARFLSDKSYAEALARLAALGQFEIPVDRVFFADPDVLEQDLVVERRESRRGDPQLLLYHATPARYLALAHIHHIRGRRHFNTWTLDMLSDYLLSRPSNFFEVFYQLYRNKLRDLQYHLFADLPLEELFQAHLDNAGQVDELDIAGAAGFIQGVWQWGKATANTLAPRLVERVDRWLARQDYAALRQLSLSEVGWLLSLKFASATTRRWLAHLDYPQLGECSRDMGLGTVRVFLQLATQVGVEKAALRAFAEGLDFKALGEQSQDVGFASIEVFLRKVSQVGVSSEKLRLFCAQLNWHTLGQSVVAEPDKLRNMLFVFNPLFRQRSISPDMALQFIEGVGWSTLRQWMQDVFSVDVLAACRDVLKVKCGFELQALRWQGVDFADPELWRRSLFRPVGEVHGGQKQLQARYFKDALRLLEQDGVDRLLRRARTLKDLGILLHNLEQISPTWLVQEVEPRLRAWSAAKWQGLLDQADVLNLGYFLHRFSPRDGLFQWPLPIELRFSLDGKIRQTTLLALAHLLFNFFFIQRPEQSRALALHLEAENGYIQEQLVAATLAEIEFFFWNYWLALPPEHEARLFRLPGLPDSLRPKLGAKLEYEAHWLGLAGSWRMATAPGLDTIQSRLRPVEVLHICRELAAQKSPVLIRSLIGLSLVCPELADADRRLFAEALESTALPGLNIPAQEQALAYLEDWLEAT